MKLVATSSMSFISASYLLHITLTISRALILFRFLNFKIQELEAENFWKLISSLFIMDERRRSVSWTRFLFKKNLSKFIKNEVVDFFHFHLVWTFQLNCFFNKSKSSSVGDMFELIFNRIKPQVLNLSRYFVGHNFLHVFKCHI